MSKKERAQMSLDDLRDWSDRGQYRPQWVSQALDVSVQTLAKWFSGTEAPSSKQMSRIRELLKQIAELEIGDLINCALFGGRGKLTPGKPDQGEPDILINLPQGKFWIEIGEATYGEEHKEELSLLRKRSVESLLTRISKNKFSNYSIPRGIQVVINNKAEKTYSVSDPVNLVIVHYGSVDDSASTIDLFRQLSRPPGFGFAKILLVYRTPQCGDDQWHVMQQYPLPEQHFLATSSYLK